VARQTKIDEKKVARFKAEVPKVLAHIDKYFLAGGQFIGGGSAISVADLMGVCELTQLYPVYEEHLYLASPNIRAWMERVRDTLNPHYDEGHAIVYRTREAFAKIGPSLGAQL